MWRVVKDEGSELVLKGILHHTHKLTGVSQGIFNHKCGDNDKQLADIRALVLTGVTTCKLFILIFVSGELVFSTGDALSQPIFHLT